VVGRRRPGDGRAVVGRGMVRVLVRAVIPAAERGVPVAGVGVRIGGLMRVPIGVLARPSTVHQLTMNCQSIANQLAINCEMTAPPATRMSMKSTCLRQRGCSNTEVREREGR